MGDKDVLAAVNSIVLDTIYLQDLDEQQTLTYTISLPEGTELVGEEKTATVTIVMEGVSERYVTVNNFDFKNIPEGYEAVPVTESLEILLRGLTTELDVLSGAQLTVVADLKNVQDEGSYTVPVTVTVNGYDNVGVKGSYQVIVSVAKNSSRMVPSPDAALQTASDDGELDAQTLPASGTNP
jgi:hypothetical protein